MTRFLVFHFPSPQRANWPPIRFANRQLPGFPRPYPRDALKFQQVSAPCPLLGTVRGDCPAARAAGFGAAPSPSGEERGVEAGSPRPSKTRTVRPPQPWPSEDAFRAALDWSLVARRWADTRSPGAGPARGRCRSSGAPGGGRAGFAGEPCLTPDATLAAVVRAPAVTGGWGGCAQRERAMLERFRSAVARCARQRIEARRPPHHVRIPTATARTSAHLAREPALGRFSPTT